MDVTICSYRTLKNVIISITTHAFRVTSVLLLSPFCDLIEVISLLGFCTVYSEEDKLLPMRFGSFTKDVSISWKAELRVASDSFYNKQRIGLDNL